MATRTKKQRPNYHLSGDKDAPKERETLEEYLARGGTIKRCPAPWDTEYDGQRKQENKSTWGSWGSYAG